MYFPDGGITSGFGGTGNVAGTYRSCDEIATAWDAIGDTEVPSMGGGAGQAQYAYATKSVYNAPSTQYPNGLLPALQAQCAALLPAGQCIPLSILARTYTQSYTDAHTSIHGRTH